MINYLLAFFAAFFIARAQAFDYAKAYQDYLYNYNIYVGAHSAYDLARSQYMASGTIASKQKAQDATSAMLMDRDQALITYLTALRMKLKETPGVVDSNRESLFSLIDNEISIYNTHKTKISSAGSLDDLVADSTEAATQFGQTELLSYQVLLSISIGETTEFRTREKDIISALRTKIAEIKVNGDKKVDSVDRALTDAEDKLSRSQEKEQEAQTTLSKLKVTNKDKLSTFNNAETSMGEALSYIKEANTIVKDSIMQIKTAD